MEGVSLYLVRTGEMARLWRTPFWSVLVLIVDEADRVPLRGCTKEEAQVGARVPREVEVATLPYAQIGPGFDPFGSGPAAHLHPQPPLPLPCFPPTVPSRSTAHGSSTMDSPLAPEGAVGLPQAGLVVHVEVDVPRRCAPHIASTPLIFPSSDCG